MEHLWTTFNKTNSTKNSTSKKGKNGTNWMPPNSWCNNDVSFDAQNGYPGKCLIGEGHCENDYGCAAGLRCFKRKTGEAVPGVNFKTTFPRNVSVCYDPNTEIKLKRGRCHTS